VAEAEPAGALVVVHEVEEVGVWAEGVAAAWARLPGVEGGHEVGAQLVVLGVVAALLA
jgi:hypothetical protein